VTRRSLGTALLVLGVLALFVVPLLLDGGTSEFAGSDSLATAAVEEDHPGYEPWFESLFSPSSAEVQSGLFAVQAALGGGALGYVLGRFRRRRVTGRSPAGPGTDPS
jgi:cobalt/nickel transport protein